MVANYHLIEVGLSPNQIKTLQNSIEKNEGCVFKLSKKSMNNPNTSLMVNSVKYRKWMMAKEQGRGFHLKLNKKELKLNKSMEGRGVTKMQCKECGHPLQFGKGVGDTLKSMGSKILENPDDLQATVSSSLQGLKSDPRVAAATMAVEKGLNVGSQIADKLDKTGKTGTVMLEINKYVRDFDPIGLLNYAIDKIGDAIKGKSQYNAEIAARNHNQAISNAKKWLNTSEDSQLAGYNAKLRMLNVTSGLAKKILSKVTPDTFEEYKQMMVEVANRKPVTTSQMLAAHRAKLGLGLMKVKKKKSLPESNNPKLITAQAVMRLRHQLNMNQQD